MKVLINYANAVFQEGQALNCRTGVEVAGFDRVIAYGPQDIDPVFFARNRHILSQPRGNGYWLWKPYFIARSLEVLKDGDFLFYCDAGAYFCASITPLIAVAENENAELIPFELTLLERVWTKRDAFRLMGCDEPRFVDSCQRLASFSLWRKTPFAVAFVNEWLHYAQDERILTDLENQLGFANYADFRDHRHDQSIFSLLTKKHGVKAHRHPSQWGATLFDRYPDSNYPQLIVHTRKRNKVKVR